MRLPAKKSGYFWAAWVFLALTGNSSAQTEETPVFRPALPGYEYNFPQDHYSHDDFRIEWWYYTGNLESAEGKRFGYQVTFFRVALEGTKKIANPSKWKIGQIYFAHLTVTDIADQKFHFFERINRKGLMNAGAESDRFLVWNEDWVLTERGRGASAESHRIGNRGGSKAHPNKRNGFPRQGRHQP